MGVLTDLIIATEHELAAAGPDEVPINVLPGLDIKGTGLIELATLHSIFARAVFDADLADFPAISGEESADGPWVFRFPDALIHRLANATPDELTRVTAEWGNTEEVAMSGWSLHELRERLDEMSEFARKTLQAGKPVHIWTCL